MLIMIRTLRQMLIHRSQTWVFVKQDIHQRYAGSILGLLWLIVLPVLQLSVYAGLYAFVFKIRPQDLDSTGYIIFVFSGLVPLMSFSEGLNAAMGSMAQNKALFSTTVFPIELIPVRAVLAAQATGLVGLVITIFASITLGIGGSPFLLIAPIIWILMILFTIGLGWILSLLCLVAKDVHYTVSVLIMLCFMLSPFAYTPDMVPDQLRPLLYFNPLSYFVWCFQALICFGRLPDVTSLIAIIAFSIGSCGVGLWMFVKAKHIFLDHV